MSRSCYAFIHLTLKKTKKFVYGETNPSASTLTMSRVDEIMGLNGHSDNEADMYGSSEDEMSKSKHFSASHDVQSHSEDDDEDDFDENATNSPLKNETSDTQLRKEDSRVLTEEENRKRLKQMKKSGVIYLSTIPPYMKPIKLRQILERFGEVGRIYLSPEDPKAYSARVKSGGNRKKKFVEGWAEYLNKKNAKLAVDALNGNPLGGKKGSFYHDDIMNMIYLPKFKWHDLTEQIALEAQERQEKLKAEIAQATRENRVFIDNVEKKDRMERLKRKAESGENDDKVQFEEPKFKRTFDQKPVKKSKRQSTEGSADLQNVLSKVF